MTAFFTSMSARRSSASSPNRSAHQAASSAISRYRSGRALTRVSSSGRDAGRILRARLDCPAPRIRHGFAGISSSSTAVPMIVRSSA